MTRDKFMKLCFKGFVEVEYQPPSWDEPKAFMLAGVDYENEVIKLIPFDGDVYVKESFWVNYEHVEFYRGLKISKSKQ